MASGLTRASVRGSAFPAVWHRYPRLGVFATLAPRQRNLHVARASTRAPRAPRYTVVDVNERGAAYYAPPSTPRAPHWSPLQAALIDAVRMLRRWDRYASAAVPAAEPNQPLDGCRCRACILRAA
jgi:hypothetical protein